MVNGTRGDGPAGIGVPRPTSYGALERKDYAKFVQFFRQASPYIEGHRGRTFVIVVPGEVVDDKDILNSLLEDIALLHGLGVKLVIVLGARQRINKVLREHGTEPKLTAGLRVTDGEALQAAIEAAGSARMEVEAKLSKGPAVSMVRRHARSSSQFHYGPGVQTVAGNYVAAKRKGVIGGVDFQHTGVVRFVQVDAVRKQLDAGNIVLLSNLGYSAAGEVLNCDAYTVATRAAIDLDADKLLVMTTPVTLPLPLPQWLPLSDAERLLSQLSSPQHLASLDGALGSMLLAGLEVPSGNGAAVSSWDSTSSSGGSSKGNGNGAGSGVRTTEQSEELYDFEKWAQYGLPPPLMSAVVACKNGVKRAHLVDARMDGSLLLELYSRDGLGSMISADFYEGIRPAQAEDLDSLAALLRPLEEKGVLVQRSRRQLEEELPYFTVFEQGKQVLGCALVKPLGMDSIGVEVAELGAVCVHPDFRGSGRGDSLLDYLEQDARARGVQRLVLLTTRTADWFQQRGFVAAGPAHASNLLPPERRSRVNALRNSQLYYKSLMDDSSDDAEL